RIGDHRRRPAGDTVDRFRPGLLVGAGVPLHRRYRPWRRAAAVLLLHRRIRAEEYPRPHHRADAIHRRRLAVAGRAFAHNLFPRHDRLARHLDHYRHWRAGDLRLALLTAGIAALAGDARPRPARARPVAAHGTAHRADRGA